MNIENRIKELITREELSNKEFAQRIKMNPSIISHILNGRNKPSLQVIDSIKQEFTNVNLEYLISGIGTLYDQFTNVNSINQPEPLEKELETVSQEPLPLPTIKPEITSTKVKHEKKVEVEKIHDPTPPPFPAVKGAEIEQIVVFYTDGSFKTYKPKND